ncbi:MAG: glutamine--tRNA ligase/YqeY domain fusion protein [Gemmiger sp.]|nr:glutamine--tRNA ligase/YqeY domain fusion protein [Gemmiger sp.]MDR3917006.1 glutamine--tRNA ligase/YqeY domain fusion protein [Gemmiger sp.]
MAEEVKTAAAEGESGSKNFIDAFIEEDIAEGGRFQGQQVHTRFPPEPNGYLHIGHCKALTIDFGTAERFGGLCNLRMDDTNPTKEDVEFVDAIKEDIHWLGFDWGDRFFYGSDYFEKDYEYAVELIKKGLAYVCDLTPEQAREYRGDIGKPAISPYRDRDVEENLDLFERMKNGEFPEGSRTLRAKIDLASGNFNMRDPVIYRIRYMHHHRQGDKWCIYPMYDFAHPIQDAIEGITFSLCSLEFENHRPLYEWVITNLFGKEFPKQREFARLNVTNTVMSKRYLRELVEKNIVDGWDDPRMPTLSGLRRRGYTPTSIFTFVKEAGISKADNLVDMRQLEAVLRAELELNAQRRVAVLEPVKLIIDNYPADQCEYFDLPNNPNRDVNDTTTRKVAFTKELWIENSDFFEVPPPKFKRLTLGSEVRLMGAYLVRCTGVDKDENGRVVAIHAEADLETRNGNPADGRKVRGTIHWVSCAHCLDAEVELYDKLFTEANMNSIPDDADFKDYLNPDSVKVLQGAKLEESLKDAKPGDRFQFVRNGYFTPDSKHEGVYNRIVTLKDSFKL